MVGFLLDILVSELYIDICSSFQSVMSSLMKYCHFRFELSILDGNGMRHHRLWDLCVCVCVFFLHTSETIWLIPWWLTNVENCRTEIVNRSYSRSWSLSTSSECWRVAFSCFFGQESISWPLHPLVLSYNVPACHTSELSMWWNDSDCAKRGSEWIRQEFLTCMPTLQCCKVSLFVFMDTMIH